VADARRAGSAPGERPDDPDRPDAGQPGTLWRVGLFTVDEAHAELARLLPLLDEVVRLRADHAELTAALKGGPDSPLGGLPELKGATARLDELLTQVQQTGAELKGIAPLLLDFPAELDGVDVLLCWLEGDRSLRWYHRADIGFAGRRRLPGQDDAPAGLPW
jgi:arsenite methyltransferase